MKTQLVLVTALSALLLNAAHALMSSQPKPFIVTSPNGQAILKHIPHPRSDQSITVAYRLDKEGTLEELWKTSGFNLVSRLVHISNCGHYLAVCGSAKPANPTTLNYKSRSETVIEFLKDGQIVKKHSAKELVKDWSLVEEQAAGLMYNFSPSEQTTPNGFTDKTFHLTLIDGTSYHFDCTTGEIVGSGTDRNAKGYWVKHKEITTRGRQALLANPEIQSFQEHFEFSRTEANSSYDTPTSQHIHLCNEGPNWRTVMLLKKREANHIVTVHTYIPLTEHHKAILEISPEHLLHVIAKVKAHPGIKAKQEEDGAFGFELFMQGDRFHWNQITLNRALRQSGKDIAETDLTQWVGIYVNDGSYRPGTRREYLFINRKTGELLELKDEE